MRSTYVFLLSVLACIQLQAATYYVRKDGSDTNAGTSDTSGGAYRNLVKANQMAQPGDTIYIGAGNFSSAAEVGYVTGSGSATDTGLNTARNGTALLPIIWIGAGKDVTFVSKFEIDNHYIHVKELTITHQIDIRYVDYTLVENVKFTWTNGRQYWVQPENNFTESTGHICRGCDFIGCGNAGAISLNGVDSLVENCYFTSSNGGDAIYLNGFRNIVRGCRVIAWNLPSGSTQHTDIFQAFKSGSGTGGEQSQDHIIENNVFADCNGCQIGNIDWTGNPVQIKNWTFRNNVFARVTNPLNLWATGFKFYNNTFYKCGNPGSGAGTILHFNDERGSANGTEYFNNIWYLCSTNPANADYGWYNFGTVAVASGLILDNNLVIGTGAGRVKSSRWNWYLNGSGQAANFTSLNGVDPLFTAAAATGQTLADYALQSTSPAIGFGKVLGTFTVDALGVTRGGSWDLGAIEFAAPEADVTPPTIASANVSASGDVLTINFSENVTSVTAAHYSIVGHTLGSVAVNGPVVTMALSPVRVTGANFDMTYTGGAGRTADTAGNLLATVTVSVTNNSLEQAPNPPLPGRRGVGKPRILMR